jgi:pilus assembly protein CpaE
MVIDMSIYLWSADLDVQKSNAIEHRLRKVLPELVTISGIEDIPSAPARQSSQRNYLLAVVSSHDRRIFAKLIDIASHYREQFFLILISDQISIDDYKAMMRTGGADWVSTNAAPQEILEIISQRQARAIVETRAPSPPGGGPVVISFVPSAGGVGNTTLVVEAAIYLKTHKATRDRKICLVDLDFQSSNVCDYLDIEPRLQIQEISTNPERLDTQLFDIFVSRHASGLDVFAAPRAKFEYCDLDVSALDTLFNIASERYELMLIDLPVTWFTWTSNIIAASDAVVVTGANTVPGLRQTVETLVAIRAIAHAPEKVVVAVNRCRRRLVGGIARRHHVETTLGREQVFYVGEEPMALESVNIGRPMTLGRKYGAFGNDVAALAGFCTSVKSSRAERH